MEKSLLNRKMFFAVLTLFVFVFAIQMAEPASAAKWKKFDKGQKDLYNGQVTYNWVSYKKGTKYAKIYSWWTNHYTGKKARINFYLTKISKKVIRIKTTSGSNSKTQYYRTKWGITKAAKWWIRN